jgi:peptidoglycan/LPS O-acetylase OafA/YrhL
MLKRLARIIPLAWLALTIVFLTMGASNAEWRANLFFYANLPPFYLTYTGHFWSLCIEMQFYMGIACVVLLFGRRGLWLVPAMALIVTGLRVVTESYVSIVTWFRIDEILAGGILALIIHVERAAPLRSLLLRCPFIPVLLFFLLSSRPELGPLNYVRPYLAATMVGITILRPIRWLSPILASPPARYVAKISYALYVIHPYSMAGWLGSGDVIVKYAKRPIAFAITFGLAHLSTFYFERPINDWAHRLSKRWPFAPVGKEARPQPG